MHSMTISHIGLFKFYSVILTNGVLQKVHFSLCATVFKNILQSDKQTGSHTKLMYLNSQSTFLSHFTLHVHIK